MPIMLVLFYIGLVLIVCGAVRLVCALLRLRRCCALGTATILSAEPTGSGKKLRLTVQAEIGGDTLTLSQTTGSAGRLRNRTGDRLDIRYNPDKPSDFIIEETFRPWPSILLCVIIGIILIFAGGLLSGPFATRLPFGRYFIFLRWRLQNRLFM